VSKPTDVRIVSSEIHFLGVQTRVPLKFGPETLREVTCARERMRADPVEVKSLPCGALRWWNVREPTSPRATRGAPNTAPG
jgi:hypothetical protein